MNTQAKLLDGADIAVTLRQIPDSCPRCHKSVHPKVRYVSITESRGLVQAVFQCVASRCQEMFIGSYKSLGSRGMYEVCDLVSIAPVKALDKAFPDTVAGVSSLFIEIYNQALAAEAQGLSQLVGIGLRKALEFLIKDFACTQHPEDAAKIKSMNLAPCIEAYVADSNLKDCAKRAVWLGNDETHYVRKWEQSDISDLKLLVQLTSNWIDNVLLTQQYVAKMQPAK